MKSTISGTGRIKIAVNKIMVSASISASLVLFTGLGCSSPDFDNPEEKRIIEIAKTEVAKQEEWKDLTVTGLSLINGGWTVQIKPTHGEKGEQVKMEFSSTGNLESYYSGPKKIIELVKNEAKIREGLSKSEIRAKFVNGEWLVSVAPIPSPPGGQNLAIVVNGKIIHWYAGR